MKVKSGSFMTAISSFTGVTLISLPQEIMTRHEICSRSVPGVIDEVESSFELLVVTVTLLHRPGKSMDLFEPMVHIYDCPVISKTMDHSCSILCLLDFRFRVCSGLALSATIPFARGAAECNILEDINGWHSG